MPRKLQINLLKYGTALASCPVRIEHSKDVINGIREALTQFANTLPEEGMGENGVSMSVQESDASEL